MFPELATTRFNLKQIQAADQPFIFEGLSHPEVIAHYGVSYDSMEAASAQMDFYANIWKEKTGCWWKIVDKQTHLPVGACGINDYHAAHEKAEIGYWLLPPYWGQGIMQEVVPVMIRYVFDHWKLHRLEAVIEDCNPASSRLAEKLGFSFEGRLRESEIKDGKRISLLMYSMLAAERPR